MSNPFKIIMVAYDDKCTNVSDFYVELHETS